MDFFHTIESVFLLWFLGVFGGLFLWVTSKFYDWGNRAREEDVCEEMFKHPINPRHYVGWFPERLLEAVPTPICDTPIPRAFLLYLTTWVDQNPYLIHLATTEWLDDNNPTWRRIDGDLLDQADRQSVDLSIEQLNWIHYNLIKSHLPKYDAHEAGIVKWRRADRIKRYNEREAAKKENERQNRIIAQTFPDFEA